MQIKLIKAANHSSGNMRKTEKRKKKQLEKSKCEEKLLYGYFDPQTDD